MTQIGRALPRPNARRLVEGGGRYVADRAPARLLHAVFVRSPYAHAAITHIDLAAARAAPGVVAAYDGADMATQITPWVGVLTHMVGMRSPPQPALAVGRTHWAGEPVAMVLATSRALAEDAAELVVVDYDPLPPIADIEAALTSDQTSAGKSASMWARWTRPLPIRPIPWWNAASSLAATPASRWNPA